MNHTFSQVEFDQFARLSGDDNPIHVDAEFASKRVVDIRHRLRMQSDEIKAFIEQVDTSEAAAGIDRFLGC